MSVDDELSPGLHGAKARRTLVVADVVESVRLMLAYESDVIDRWRRFVDEVVRQVLPAHQGRMVKSLGDGMLLEFETVHLAVAASMDMQRRMPSYNVGRTPDAAMHLRVGAHEADVVVDKFDVFGAGVNLAARLGSLAGPGEVVVSAQVRDKLIADVDAVVHDMGDCYLKHIEEPVRAFRLVPKPTPGMAAANDETAHALPGTRPLVPRIAVMPFANASDEARLMRAGESVGDDLIATMSRCPYWQITSRLSTAALAPRQLDLRELGRLLKVDFVVTGSISLSGPNAHLKVELAEVMNGTVLWSESISLRVDELMMGPQAAGPRVSNLVMRAVLRREMELAHVSAMPNLPSYALLLQAISLLHSWVPSQASRALSVLAHLEDRHPRSPDVFGWQAYWHLGQVYQRNAVDDEQAVRLARRNSQKALELDIHHAMSLVVQGHLKLSFDRDLEGAERLLRQALRSNPSESTAWLFIAQSLVLQGRRDEALAALAQSQQLSPLDPLAYFHEVFAASVYSAADRHEQALAHAERAVMANSNHLSSLAMLIIARELAGQRELASEAAKRYLAFRPDASVARFLSGHIVPGSTLAVRDAQALRSAGIPE
jgi:adenylate cyclase